MKRKTLNDEFFIPANKEERKTLLKQFISTHLAKDWLTMSKHQADVERRFLRHLIDSL